MDGIESTKAMDDFELLQACERMKKCELKRGKWDAELKELRAAITREMGRRGAESVNIGKYTIRKTTYMREQIDAKKLKAEHPEVYNIYCRANRVTTLTVNV